MAIVGAGCSYHPWCTLCVCRCGECCSTRESRTKSSMQTRLTPADLRCVHSRFRQCPLCNCLRSHRLRAAIQTVEPNVRRHSCARHLRLVPRLSFPRGRSQPFLHPPFFIVQIRPGWRTSTNGSTTRPAGRRQSRWRLGSYRVRAATHRTHRNHCACVCVYICASLSACVCMSAPGPRSHLNR